MLSLLAMLAAFAPSAPADAQKAFDVARAE